MVQTSTCFSPAGKNGIIIKSMLGIFVVVVVVVVVVVLFFSLISTSFFSTLDKLI